MRNTFINRLTELAKTHEDIFLLCGDLGYSVLEPFSQQFPDRYLNVGISEQNMTGVAAGLSREGYNVFTYSIGNFPTLRCMEQIRYDVCYHEANVKVVAVGAGYAYGPQGVSHHTTEDIGMLRVLPNMTVCVPADPIEAMLAAKYMAELNGPGYIRLNKSGEVKIHEDIPVFHPGAFIKVSDGVDVCVLVTGPILSEIKKEIRACGKQWGIYSAPFVGGYLKEQLLSLVKNYKIIITVEEHQLNGGFGSSIVEEISDLYASGEIRDMPKIKRLGIDNQFIGVCGDQEYLRGIAGLNLRKIISQFC